MLQEQQSRGGFRIKICGAATASEKKTSSLNCEIKWIRNRELRWGLGGKVWYSFFLFLIFNGSFFTSYVFGFFFLSLLRFFWSYFKIYSHTFCGTFFQVWLLKKYDYSQVWLFFLEFKKYDKNVWPLHMRILLSMTIEKKLSE